MIEENDEELTDEEYPDPADIDAGESADTEVCPDCGEPIYGQAEVCPRCHNYVSLEGPGNRRRVPAWIIAGAVITLVLVIAGWLMLDF